MNAPVNKKCEKCTEFIGGQKCQCKTCAINDICEMAQDENCAINLVCQRHVERR